MIGRGDMRRSLHTRHFPCAFAPFARNIWTHPQVPADNFDHVCKIIWKRELEVEQEMVRGQSSPERQRHQECGGKKANDRARERQKEDKDKQWRRTGFTLPCPYLAGHKQPHAAEAAQVHSSVMEGEMRREEEDVEEEAKWKKHSVKHSQDEKRSLATNILVTQSITNRDMLHSFAVEPESLTTNNISSTTEDHTPLPSKELGPACESDDEHLSTGSSFDNSSSDGSGYASLPGVRACATDSDSSDDSGGDTDCKKVENKIQHTSEKLSSEQQQDSPIFNTDLDFPPLPTDPAGTLPYPMKPTASGKVHGQWEIPLSFHPHNIPAATLERGLTTHAQAPVQGKAAEAPQANLKTTALPAAPVQQEAYDLLADFPGLQPPKKPLALGALRDGCPRRRVAEGKRGLTRSPHNRQESGAAHQRRMENVPHEVSSICAGDQKAVLDLQTFGPSVQCNSPAISCEELEANNEPPPRVAGTDGVGVQARTWASAARAAMKQAAAPQEKARPCAFQQIVTINKAKVQCTAAQNFVNRAAPLFQPPRQFRPAAHRGPRPQNPTRFFRPGFRPPAQQHFGAQAHRANCPPGFGCPRFPFQQARGNLSRPNHV